MGIITTVSYNGKKLDPKKFRVEHLPDYSIPVRDLEQIHIEGRSGDIVVDNGSYKNVPRTYSISFGATGAADFAASVSEITRWLISDGYAELSDSYEKDYFRLAVPSGEPEVKSYLNGRMGKVDIEFSCVPKRFLVFGNKDFNYVNSANNHLLLYLFNPSLFDSKPIITLNVNGSGNSYISLSKSRTGDTLFRVDINPASTPTEPIVLDCEQEYVYSKDTKTNLNSITTLSNGFPMLMGNSNTYFTIGGNIQSFIVRPRFWTM